MSENRYGDSLSSLALHQSNLVVVAEHAESLADLAKQKDEILAVVNGNRPIFVPELRAFQIAWGL